MFTIIVKLVTDYSTAIIVIKIKETKFEWMLWRKLFWNIHEKRFPRIWKKKASRVSAWWLGDFRICDLKQAGKVGDSF